MSPESVNNAETASTNEPEGEVPPEPEEEGFRERVMAEEKDRKLRAAEKFDERSTEAQKTYKGVDELGDTPGSALADRKTDGPQPVITGDKAGKAKG